MANNLFYLQKWHAWAPGINGSDEWREYLLNKRSIDAGSSPDVTFMPKMARRRMGVLSKAVAYVSHQCAGGEVYPSIYSSCRGESSRTCDILDDIAAGTDVSPAAFSLSVHNAIAGQMSIATKNTSGSVVFASFGDGMLSALMEVCGRLMEEDKPVFVVFYDEVMPKHYQEFCDELGMVYALGMLFSNQASTISVQFDQDSRNFVPKEQHQHLLEWMNFLLLSNHANHSTRSRGISALWKKPHGQ